VNCILSHCIESSFAYSAEEYYAQSAEKSKEAIIVDILPGLKAEFFTTRKIKKAPC